MQITKTLKEPVAGKTQVGLCSCSEIGPILQGMIRSLQAGGLLNHVGGCSQSNYPHCVYIVPIRAAGLPVWTQGCVDTYSINTSLERFFISLDLKKKVRVRNVIPHRGFSFLSFFLLFCQDTEHHGEQKPYSFYYDLTSTIIGWCCSTKTVTCSHKNCLIPEEIVSKSFVGYRYLTNTSEFGLSLRGLAAELPFNKHINVQGTEIHAFLINITFKSHSSPLKETLLASFYKWKSLKTVGHLKK